MLYSHGLRLPWEDLCRELELHFAPIDAGLTIFEKKDHKQLIKLASRANYFFARDCLPKFTKKWVHTFAVNSSALVMSSLSLFLQFYTNGVEDENDIRHYIQSFFYMWEKLNKTNGFDVQISSRLGIIAMSTLSMINDDIETRKFLKLGGVWDFHCRSDAVHDEYIN